jgi:hypothetical protein
MTLTAGLDPRGEPVTRLCGPVADQAALRGLVSRIWDLNLAIVSMACIE